MAEPDNMLVDHEETAEVVKQLRAHADELDQIFADAQKNVLQAFTDQASLYTRDGNPAPIFQDVLTATKAALERFEETKDVIAKTFRDDADALEKGSASAQEDEDAAVKGINDTDTSI